MAQLGNRTVTFFYSLECAGGIGRLRIQGIGGMFSVVSTGYGKSSPTTTSGKVLSGWH